MRISKQTYERILIGMKTVSRRGDDLMFKKGDVVLYGIDGICEISDISTVDIPGVSKDRLYYILRQKTGNGTIYIPVDGDISRMRKLISKEEALKIVSQISVLEPLKLKDEKKPEAEYKAVLQQYDCIEMLKLIKCIYFRKRQRISEGKKATAADEKYMRQAEDILYQEIGAVLGIQKDQVLDYLIGKIEGKC